MSAVRPPRDLESHGRFYTRARRIPIMIGRLYDGTAIPGGPYTIWQGLVAVVTLIVLVNTTWIWARAGFLVNLIVFVAILGGAIFVTGRIPTTGRNPLFQLAGFLKLLAGPAPTWRGRRITVRPPHQVTGRVVIHDFPLVLAALPAASAPTALVLPQRAEPRSTTVELPVPTASPPPTPSLSGVARLLVASLTKDHDA